MTPTTAKTGDDDDVERNARAGRAARAGSRFVIALRYGSDARSRTPDPRLRRADVDGETGADGRGASQVGVAGLESMDSRTLAIVFMAGAFLLAARGCDLTGIRR